MKTFTQIVLPLAALAGLVFGVTWIVNYSAKGPDGNVSEKKAGQTHGLLQFNTIVGRNDPDVVSLKYWRNQFEPGEDGHFDFWFRNPNDKPVQIAFATASCKCAGSQLGQIAPSTWDNYIRTSSLCSWPGGHGMLLLAAIANAELASRIEWKQLSRDGKLLEEGTVAAASASEPGMGIIRVEWKAKPPEGSTKISANFQAHAAGIPKKEISLETDFIVAPPFDVVAPSSGGRSIRLGEIGPQSVVERDFFVWSRTRPSLSLDISSPDLTASRDCVVWSAPIPLNSSELELLGQQLGTKPKCAYRVSIVVRERVEVQDQGPKSSQQLDLGPLLFTLKVRVDDSKGVQMPVQGIVRGEVRIRDASSGDRIDFGSFRSSESRSSQVTLVSNRADFEMELDSTATAPAYLQTTLTSEGEKDGQRQWILRVTIPAGKLSGSLQNSFIILKAKGDTSRRIRIPVKATAFDGGPGF